MMRYAPLLLIVLLAGCGGEDAPVASVATRPPPGRLLPPTQRRNLPLSAHIQNLPGLEGVIGVSSAELRRQFGEPRLEVVEGDARKLQFTGSACVLDVYLYSAALGREPEATYVDARRSDGRDVDRAACVAALRKR